MTMETIPLALALLAPGAKAWSAPRLVVSSPLFMENWADFASLTVWIDAKAVQLGFLIRKTRSLDLLAPRADDVDFARRAARDNARAIHQQFAQKQGRSTPPLFALARRV